jgi:hypothetical protein
MAALACHHVQRAPDTRRRRVAYVTRHVALGVLWAYLPMAEIVMGEADNTPTTDARFRRAPGRDFHKTSRGRLDRDFTA